jgi:hypothetical protein
MLPRVHGCGCASLQLILHPACELYHLLHTANIHKEMEPHLVIHDADYSGHMSCDCVAITHGKLKDEPHNIFASLTWHASVHEEEQLQHFLFPTLHTV